MNASQGLALVHHLRRCVSTNPRGWCGRSPSLWRGCINTSRRTRRHMTVPFCLFFLVLYFSTHSACVFSMSLYTVASPHNFPRQSITGKVFWFLGNSVGKYTWSQQYIVSVDVIQRYGNIIDIQYMCMPQSIIDIQYNTIRLNSRLFSRRGFLMGKKKPQ